MKRKKVRAKTKTKSKTQFKDLGSVILAVVLLAVIIVASKGYFKVGPSEAARRSPAPIQNLDASSRDWPSMALKPTRTVASEDLVSPTGPGDPGPSNPTPSDITTPYAFVRAGSAGVSYGPVYYSSGPEAPHVVFSGNAVTPTPSGDYVFFIRIDSLMGNFPSRTTPVKLNINTGVVTELAAPRSYPLMWNSLVPADEGKDYIYGAIGFESPDFLSGPMYIVDDGVQVYGTYGSYLFPTLSTDGTKAAWSYDPSPNSFGDRDTYIFNVATRVATKIHDVNTTRETQYPTLSRGGLLTAWTVAINTPGVGLRTQEVWFKWLTSSSGIQLDTLDYIWSELPHVSHGPSTIPKLNKEPLVSPLQMVFHSNKDPYVYAGYNILYVNFPMVSNERNVKAMELTTYASNVQRLWPDIDNNKFVIFSSGGGNSYPMYLAHTDFAGWMTQIINPGGVNRDVGFKN